jgi:exonuclease SbcD
LNVWSADVRIVHTSDWHAGRAWKSIDRLPELAAVLDHLAGFLEKEAIDLLLVSGDVFDSGAPRPEAERAVFDFLKRVGHAGTRTVVIAGNHDSGPRLEAWGLLAELVGVHAVGRPKRADQGGVVEIPGRKGGTAVVAALPFAAPRYLVSALDLAQDETLAMQHYADGVRAMVNHLSARFRPDAVNLLMAHTHLENAAYSGSERKVHLGDEWAASPQGLPTNAHYIALGHIHRPQRVPAPSPAEYAGSPLQLDFGEAGEAKSFVVVDAEPGRPAKVERVPYQGGTPLATFEGTLEEIEREKDRLAKAGWLRVTVRVDQPRFDLNSLVRKVLPNAISVDVALPEAVERPADGGSRRAAAPRDLYKAFHQRLHELAPDEALLDAFVRLYDESAAETD